MMGESIKGKLGYIFKMNKNSAFKSQQEIDKNKLTLVTENLKKKRFKNFINKPVSRARIKTWRYYISRYAHW